MSDESRYLEWEAEVEAKFEAEFHQALSRVLEADADLLDRLTQELLEAREVVFERNGHALKASISPRGDWLSWWVGDLDRHQPDSMSVLPAPGHDSEQRFGEVRTRLAMALMNL